MSSYNHGFILSDIFSRYFEIASVDPVSLIGSNESTTVSEISLKISKLFPGSEGIRNLSDLRKFLLRRLRDEALEFIPLSRIFLDYHMIQCFFMVYNNEKEDVVSYHIGYFNQLKCMSFCKDFRDIKNLVLKDSSIEGYFDEVEDASRMDLVYSKVMKNFYTLNWDGIPEEEVKIFLGNLPNCSEIVNGVMTRREIAGGISLTDEEISEIRGLSPSEIHRKLVRVYRRSFDTFGDISVVYSYLKFRELQIREILYTSEQALNKEV